jgi:hypothetical protein
MKIRRSLLMLSVILFMTAANRYGFDQPISGAAKVKLTGPLSNEQMEKCKNDAKFHLKPSILQWLQDQREIEVDTTDLLTNLLFNGFLDSCLTRSKEASAFKEAYWTFSYTILPEAIDAALASYNDRAELLAANSWKRLQNAISQKNNEETYYQSVEVIAYSTSYLGQVLAVPGDSNKILVEEARSILKDFLERVSISSTGQIIEGKPGYPTRMSPSMSVSIDGMPFAGLGMSGYIPGSGGADIYNGVADNTGVLTFDNLIMPFVKTGAMMYVSPNLGRVINGKWRVGMKDFGLKVKKDLNQSFFFKVNRPAFTLNFTAATTDPTDTIPKKFASGASIRTFLIDSCFMQEVPAGTPADLNFTINCEASSANFSLMESSEARFNCSVTIQAPTLTPPRTESETFTLEKKYDKIPLEYAYTDKKSRDKDPKIPLGSLIWEANIKLHKTIRNILNRF